MIIVCDSIPMSTELGTHPRCCCMLICPYMVAQKRTCVLLLMNVGRVYQCQTVGWSLIFAPPQTKNVASGD